MSHYANLVIIEKPDAEPEEMMEAIESAVESAMGPSEDNGGFWDWYQIGGRWTGTFDGYDPDKDPANLIVCTLCNGTGDRKDLDPPAWKAECGGCNGCHGTGKQVTWPTQWAKREGDVMPVDQLTEEQFNNFYRVVVDGNAFGGMEYLPWKPIESMFSERERPPLDWLKKTYAGRLAVIVDNHS